MTIFLIRNQYFNHQGVRKSKIRLTWLHIVINFHWINLLEANKNEKNSENWDWFKFVIRIRWSNLFRLYSGFFGIHFIHLMSMILSRSTNWVSVWISVWCSEKSQMINFDWINGTNEPPRINVLFFDWRTGDVNRV